MKISIIGSGYVGLVTGACLARADQNVTCLDIDEKKIQDLESGKIPIYEPGLEDLIKEKVENNLLSFSSNIDQAIKKTDAIFMHCLPAHRGEEISKDLLEDRRSAVWQEAGNRLHTQKALLEFLVTPN